MLQLVEEMPVRVIEAICLMSTSDTEKDANFADLSEHLWENRSKLYRAVRGLEEPMESRSPPIVLKKNQIEIKYGFEYKILD